MSELRDCVLMNRFNSEPVIYADVYGDERFIDGKVIRTSAVRKIDFIEKKIYTENSVYDFSNFLDEIEKNGGYIR